MAGDAKDARTIMYFKTKMEALDQFMKPKLLCQDISTVPLEVVGIDVIDHKNETYVIVISWSSNKPLLWNKIKYRIYLVHDYSLLSDESK